MVVKKNEKKKKLPSTFKSSAYSKCIRMRIWSLSLNFLNGNAKWKTKKNSYTVSVSFQLLS